MTYSTSSTGFPQQLDTEVPSDPLTLGFIVLFALSELIGMSKLKSNSIIQVIQRLISGFKPARKEDELVSQLREDVTDLAESIDELKKAVVPSKSPARKPTIRTK